MMHYRTEFPVERMAAVLEVSRSGYYAWIKNGETAFRQQQTTFDAIVLKVFTDMKRRFGRRRLTRELHHRGIACSVNRVGSSMRRQDLRTRRSRKFIATTDSRHSFRVAPNLLNRVFEAEHPNQVWVSDITYLRCKNGWLYLVIFLDLYARRIVGWHVSHSLEHQTVLAAFNRAVHDRGSVRELVLHSDRGVQYCCDGFREKMELHGVVQSMSRKGDCWDNAVAESFFATLKKELPTGMVFTDVHEAEQYLFEYLEIDYNRHHYHSTLEYLTPADYEEQYWKKAGAEVHSVA